MNRFAFGLSNYTLKTFSGFSKASIKISGKENIPEGSVIFTANHFTRIETIFLPYHIHNITHKEIWSLAAAEIFEISILQGFLNNLGAVSTKDPNRDKLILKTLLSGDVQWIIFPEGMMVKNKKLMSKDQFAVRDEEVFKRPRTGAAIVALRTEFYRERLRRLRDMKEPEFERLMASLEIKNIDQVLEGQTHIVPVNITYYPASPKENILSRIAQIVMKDPSKRVMDELMTEGSMLFSNVNINIRFGKPIEIKSYLNEPYIESMLTVRRKIRFDDDISSKQIFRQFSIQIMEKYMAAVYAMTTLNYDHVLACVLKHFPYRPEGIDIYEFKCKVYYAIAWLTSQREIFVSDNFYKNQSHLLIDDRLKRFEDFFAIACNTGVIKIENNRIFKDQTRFVTPSDFHTIRIENPILVMANEVEPLRDVEKFLKQTAQKSRNEILSLVKDTIMEKIEVDFSNDYNDFYIEEESKKKRVGRPVFLKHDNAVAGILLIHGYMAAPKEMESFARYLYAQGYTVYVPRLKGHGTAPEDLARTTYKQWIESVEEGYIILKHTCEKIVIGGFSTGAGLALELATKAADAIAVFAVAPPMRLKDLGSYFVPAVDAWNSMIKLIRLDSIAKEYIANSPENPHINYVRNPIAGILQLEKLMESLEPELKNISLPTLVVQSRKDPVVNPRGTSKLFENIGSEFKEYYMFDYDRHGILLGDDVQRVYQAIENFIRRWVSQSLLKKQPLTQK
ncbi:MAG: alpha/beta fold hydrolase [Proteobacteria bacterium]|nr:alpha/beta fold hydrolase [Pseudomonadota bacterium]MBU1389186.1 alpha/beta fold hydrolase [Pseudomonadota bacterium]MBU1543410.1 alpha/beta fold hydrolase [Pseudomonadota bacterium]MBU2482895.1 alpha/beta fold hydrolase [Pseudomonadota bacterium]